MTAARRRPWPRSAPTRATSPATPVPPPLQALVPAHRLDAAPGGRAPAPLRLPRGAHPPRRARPRRTCTAPSSEQPLPAMVTVALPLGPGPLHRRHLVGDGRRDEALARRRRHGPVRGEPRGGGRRARPRDAAHLRGSDPRRPRRARRHRSGARARRGPAGARTRAAPAGRADRPGRDGRRRDAGESRPHRSGCAATRVPDPRWSSLPPTDASARHLAGRLGLVADRVRLAVERRRSGDPDPDDRFRGLYVSDAQVDHLLGGGHGPLLEAGDDPGRGRARARRSRPRRTPRRRRARRSGCAASPAASTWSRSTWSSSSSPWRRISTRASSASTATSTTTSPGDGPASASPSSCPASARDPGPGGRGSARWPRSSPAASSSWRMPTVPFLTRALRVPDRVAAHLLGDATPDPAVEALATTAVAHDAAGTDALEGGLRAGARLAYVRERIGTAAVTLAARALGRVGPPPVVVDLGRLGPGDDHREAAAAAIREARLRGTGLVAGPLDVVAERGPGAVRAWAEAPCPVVLHGSRGWDPGLVAVGSLHPGPGPPLRRGAPGGLARVARRERVGGARGGRGGTPLPPRAGGRRACRRGRAPRRRGSGTGPGGAGRRRGRPGPERGRPGAPGAPHRAARRLGRPRPARRRRWTSFAS